MCAHIHMYVCTCISEVSRIMVSIILHEFVQNHLLIDSISKYKGTVEKNTKKLSGLVEVSLRSQVEFIK